MSTTGTNEMHRNRRWVVPALCVVFAIGYAAVFLANDEPLAATLGAGLMLAYGLVLVLFSRRSEMLAVLRDDATDERRAMILLRSSATTLYVVVTLALVMFFVELARGHDPGPWGTMCAVGGLAFIVSVAFHSRRS
jgi:hypothetical protein